MIFQSTMRFFSGYLRKVPWKISSTRKRHIRERLKNVENNLNLLNDVGIPMKSLDRANMIPRYSVLRPVDKYSFYSLKHKCRRPVHFYRHYTKVEIPTMIEPHHKKGLN